ncbi:MAG: hypothetical protein R3D03_01590 [Geminicoccaceae bacterium]
MKRIGILQTGHTPVELADRFESYGVMVRDMVARSGKDFAYEIFPVIDGNFRNLPTVATAGDYRFAFRCL